MSALSAHSGLLKCSSRILPDPPIRACAFASRHDEATVASRAEEVARSRGLLHQAEKPDQRVKPVVRPNGLVQDDAMADLEMCFDSSRKQLEGRVVLRQRLVLGNRRLEAVGALRSVEGKSHRRVRLVHRNAADISLLRLEFLADLHIARYRLPLQSLEKRPHGRCMRRRHVSHHRDTVVQAREWQVAGLAALSVPSAELPHGQSKFTRDE